VGPLIESTAYGIAIRMGQRPCEESISVSMWERQWCSWVRMVQAKLRFCCTSTGCWREQARWQSAVCPSKEDSS
jgi:hypothetical protein